MTSDLVVKASMCDLDYPEQMCDHPSAVVWSEEKNGEAQLCAKRGYIVYCRGWRVQGLYYDLPLNSESAEIPQKYSHHIRDGCVNTKDVEQYNLLTRPEVIANGSTMRIAQRFLLGSHVEIQQIKWYAMARAKLRSSMYQNVVDSVIAEGTSLRANSRSSMYQNVVDSVVAEGTSASTIVEHMFGGRRHVMPIYKHACAASGLVGSVERLIFDIRLEDMDIMIARILNVKIEQLMKIIQWPQLFCWVIAVFDMIQFRETSLLHMSAADIYRIISPALASGVNAFRIIDDTSSLPRDSVICSCRFWRKDPANRYILQVRTCDMCSLFGITVIHTAITELFRMNLQDMKTSREKKLATVDKLHGLLTNTIPQKYYFEVRIPNYNIQSHRVLLPVALFLLPEQSPTKNLHVDSVIIASVPYLQHGVSHSDSADMAAISKF